MSNNRALALATLLLWSQACASDASTDGPSPVTARYLAGEKITYEGALVAAYRLIDREGEHALVLSRKAGESHENRNTGLEERIDLVAIYHHRVAPGKWKREWVIHDYEDCPSLDVAGDFFANAVSFSDLNKDGRMEVTVAYHLFCGGGIDPYTVKVILREGDTKLAIRGDSLVKYRAPGAPPPFGGEHKHDNELLTPGRAAYKRHLDSIWKRVYIDLR